jgi:tetrahydromethanopterin S-methyltransferase subunit A
MDKKILKDYEQACAIIRETQNRIDRMWENGTDEVQQSVKASGGFPYREKTIHMSSPSKEARMENTILKWQIERAEEIKATVEREMQEAPLRIQRIIQIKYFEGETWEETAARIGGTATAESVRKEIERFFKNQ